ncbi:hypothetical protein JQS43_11420 [Natronosporangium hydrolyticum]|uniref:Uncharacterized protein n=1 Tax=Natronosporangium hydrolyticum TaxID=2811111 RepID=A0A895YLI9_9ACTN|nr:hypothetical protein [Natronosporangium hydrolyticum]QSB16835.1 hypothetical protein JQS43_11420 [Natronosporangium hydrolyticum]
MMEATRREQPGHTITRLTPRIRPAGRALLSGLVLALVGVVGAPEPGIAEPTRPDWVQTLPQLLNDPVGAQQVLLGSTPEQPDAPDEAGRLPRVSALFQEWIYYADERWLDDVGAVLEAAATPDSDREPEAAESLIMQALVTAAADAIHSPHTGGVPDRLRPSMGRLAAAYLPDLHLVIDHDDLDAVATGTSLRHLTPRQAGVFLAEVGRNEQARSELLESIEEYAAGVFGYLLSLDGPHDDPEAALQMFVLPGIAGLVAAVDVGTAGQTYVELGERHIGLVNYRIGRLQGASRQALMAWVRISYYDQLQPDDLSEPTRGALTDSSGELIPMESWLHEHHSPEYKAWQSYLSTPGARSPSQLVLIGVVDDYLAAFDRFRAVIIDIWGARGRR